MLRFWLPLGLREEPLTEVQQQDVSAPEVEIAQHLSPTPGEGLAALLTQRLGEERVVSFRFSRPSKSHLTYQLLALINSGRLKMYQPDEAPTIIYEEAWKQLRLARYRIPAAETIDMYLDAGEGHDDFLMSIALVTEALASFTAPPESGYVRPRVLYEGEGRY